MSACEPCAERATHSAPGVLLLVLMAGPLALQPGTARAQAPAPATPEQVAPAQPAPGVPAQQTTPSQAVAPSQETAERLGTAGSISVPSLADDRLILSGSGYSLSDASGGGDASVGYIHNFDPATAFGIGGEYQTIADSNWAFGSLSASYGGGPQSARWGVYAEAHEGGGNDGTRHFGYQVLALGATGTFGSELTVLGEARQFDIDTTHGLLPKIGLSYLPIPTLQLGITYADSVTGNLDTEIGSVRIDVYNPIVNAFVGGARGHAAPAVINFQTHLLGSSPKYREGYLGLSKPYRRVELTVLGDYLNLSNYGVSSRRWTVSVICTVHLRKPAG
jgi:hypothetical protein